MTTGLAMAAVIAALGILMLAVRALQGARVVGPEVGRKLVHAGMGAVALAFPWLFRDGRPIWALAAVSIVLLGVVRFVPAAGRRLGAVLGSVDRASLGEMFFPLGIALAFTLARGRAAPFCAGVAVLAFADTAGALVGTRWGHHRYAIGGGRKSVEGSLAVWGVAFLCVAVALAAQGSGSAWSVVAAALLIALAASAVEAVAAFGLDNLLLPAVVVGLMRI
jgi:phytol kinase